jgi:hypothetical protein
LASAVVTLQLQSQVAPQIAAAASSYKALASAEQQAEQGAARYASTLQRLALADAKTATESQRLAVQTANAAKAQTQAEAAALRLARAQEQAARGSGFATQFAEGLKSGLLGIVGPAALAGGALAALKTAADLTVAGETTNRIARSFAALSQQAGTTGDVMIAALRKASGGEISDLNLQLAANKGLLLGVATSANQFADIMSVARDRAAKMGITTTQAFDDITTGIGRESPRILDNLGIIVDADAAHKAYADSIGKTVAQLTKAERMEALRNAVIAQGKSTMDAATTSINDQTNAYAKLATSIENARNRLGSYLATDTQRTASALAAIIAIDGTTASYQKAGEATAAASGDLARYVNALNPVTAATGAVNTSNAIAIDAFNQMAGTSIPRTALSITGITDAWNTFTGATTASSQAAQVQTDIEDIRARRINATTVATRASIDALSEDAQKKLESTIATAQLTQQQAQLEADSQRAAQGLLGAGDQALLLAQKYGIAANQAQFLISQQQALSNATALADQRKGEQTGTDQTADQFNKFSKLARAGQVDAANKAAADAKRLGDAQDNLALARARTSAQKIAELKRQQSRTTDPVEKLQLQAQIEQERNSAAKSHSGELGKQLRLNEGIYDSVAKQRDAMLDMEELAIRDRQQDRADQAKIRSAQAILADPRKARFHDAARDALALIDVQDRKRANELAGKASTAGAQIIGGKLYQSAPGGALPPPAPPGTPGAHPSPTGAQARPGAAAGQALGAGIEVMVYLDGAQIAANVVTRMRAGLAQHEAGGG